VCGRTARTVRRAGTGNGTLRRHRASPRPNQPRRPINAGVPPRWAYRPPWCFARLPAGAGFAQPGWRRTHDSWSSRQVRHGGKAPVGDHLAARSAIRSCFRRALRDLSRPDGGELDSRLRRAAVAPTFGRSGIRPANSPNTQFTTVDNCCELRTMRWMAKFSINQLAGLLSSLASAHSRLTSPIFVLRSAL